MTNEKIKLRNYDYRFARSNIRYFSWKNVAYVAPNCYGNEHFSIVGKEKDETCPRVVADHKRTKDGL